jgi:hypothetical protein
MEQFFLAISRALLGLASPGAKWAWRKTGKRYRERLEADLGYDGENLADRARFLTRKLLDEFGMTQRQLIDLAKFCGSDEGAHAFRLIALASIAGSPLSGVMRSALETQVESLLRLHARDASLAGSHDMAHAIVTEGEREVINDYVQLERRDHDLAMQVREIVKTPVDMVSRVRADEAQGRGEGFLALIDLLPSNVELELKNHAASMRDLYSHIDVPAPGRVLSLPIEDALVTPRAESNKNLPTGVSKDLLVGRALASSPRLILMGDPGGGKTTAVRAFVHEVSASFLQDDANFVPLIVNLRDYARAVRNVPELALYSFMAERSSQHFEGGASEPVMRYAMSTGRAALIFDGLDEVLDVSVRRNVVFRIEALVRKFALCPIVVTSRSVGYEQAPMGASFKKIFIQRFGDDEVEQFARNIFSHLLIEPDLAQEALARFMNDSRSVVDLRSNPLMLGVLCFLAARGRSLPRNRRELYSRCAEMLFDSWDEHRGVRLELEDPDAAQQAMREVALRVFQAEEEEIPEGSLLTALERFYSDSLQVPNYRAESFARQVLDAWRGRKWLLTEIGDRGGETWLRFTHRTFLEYFAAEQVCFESRTPVDAWGAIRSYATIGAATPFVQLVVEIMDRKAKGAGREILELILDDYNQSRDLDWPIALNLARIAASVVFSVQSNSTLRDRIFIALIESFCCALPDDPPKDAHVDSFSEEQSLKIWEDAEIDERERLTSLIKPLLRQACPSCLVKSPMGPCRHAVKILLELRRSPALALKVGVADGTLATALAETANDTWAWIATQTLSELIDFRVKTWLQLSLARQQFVPATFGFGPEPIRGLLMGGWPHPLPKKRDQGTLAHALILALAGLEHDELADVRWTPEHLTDILNTLSDSVALLSKSEPDHYSRMYFEPYPEVRFSVSYPPSGHEMAPAVFAEILKMVGQHGDDKFLRAIGPLLIGDLRTAWRAVFAELEASTKTEVRTSVRGQDAVIGDSDYRSQDLWEL